MSLDIVAPKGHFRPYREVTNRGFLGFSCSEPGTNCIEPLPFGGCLDTAPQVTVRILACFGLVALLHLAAPPPLTLKRAPPRSLET